MDPSTDLEKKVAIYQEVLKNQPNVDMGMLMINALQNDDKNRVSGKWKKWSYLISISTPPLGLLLALKFFFSDESDATDVAWMCVTLTAIASLIFIVGAKLLFSSSGANVSQIETITPKMIQQTLQ